MTTSPEILSRMTPALIANVLESIAQHLRDGAMPEVKPLDEIDVLHLRQIADWLDARYGTSLETISLAAVANFQQATITTLESIAQLVRNEFQTSEIAPPTLRAIANWLKTQQKEQAQ